jgi:hypothetical protein
LPSEADLSPFWRAAIGSECTPTPMQSEDGYVLVALRIDNL